MWSLNILLLLYVSSLGYNEAAHEFDFLIYTQHWPAAVCRAWMDSNPSHACALPKNPEAWSVHGIWPSVPGSMGPSFCNRTWLFDPKEIKPIESELEQSWINIEKGTPIYDLWSHEWNKHGTCAAQIPALNSEIKYFNQGLKWLQNYTMTNILAESNIVPSETKTYTENDIYQAVKTKLGVDPQIMCKHEEGKQYLWELRLCFSKTLELIDCQTTMFLQAQSSGTFSFSRVGNCLSSQVIYTESVKPPNSMLVQVYKLLIWLQWFTL